MAEDKDFEFLNICTEFLFGKRYDIEILRNFFKTEKVRIMKTGNNLEVEQNKWVINCANKMNVSSERLKDVILLYFAKHRCPEYRNTLSSIIIRKNCGVYPKTQSAADQYSEDMFYAKYNICKEPELKQFG